MLVDAVAFDPFAHIFPLSLSGCPLVAPHKMMMHTVPSPAAWLHCVLAHFLGPVSNTHGDFARTSNPQVFPMLQGGPHMHQIAGIATQLKEVQTPEFKDYIQRVCNPYSVSPLHCNPAHTHSH